MEVAYLCRDLVLTEAAFLGAAAVVVAKVVQTCGPVIGIVQSVATYSLLRMPLADDVVAQNRGREQTLAVAPEVVVVVASRSLGQVIGIVASVETFSLPKMQLAGAAVLLPQAPACLHTDVADAGLMVAAALVQQAVMADLHLEAVVVSK